MPSIDQQLAPGIAFAVALPPDGRTSRSAVAVDHERRRAHAGRRCLRSPVGEDRGELAPCPRR